MFKGHRRCIRKIATSATRRATPAGSPLARWPLGTCPPDAKRHASCCGPGVLASPRAVLGLPESGRCVQGTPLARQGKTPACVRALLSFKRTSANTPSESSWKCTKSLSSSANSAGRARRSAGCARRTSSSGFSEWSVDAFSAFMAGGSRPSRSVLPPRRMTRTSSADQMSEADASLATASACGESRGHPRGAPCGHSRQSRHA